MESIPSKEKVENHKVVVLTKENGNGLLIEAAFNRREDKIYLDIKFTNYSESSLTKFLVKFNKNSNKLNAVQQVFDCLVKPNGGTAEYSLPCDESNGDDPNYTNIVQIALKCQLGVLVFLVPYESNIFKIESNTNITPTPTPKPINTPDIGIGIIPVQQNNSGNVEQLIPL